ncbi:MAG: hypothetical protein KAH77_10435, partial [Thiomargarita sp.]|nr:hypothetical protein [Thiomargarita sp.]
MSLNNISPEPVKWFVHKPKDQVEWSKEESDQVTLLAQADVLFLISQLFVSPTANLQIFLKKEVPDIKELLSQAQIPKSE